MNLALFDLDHTLIPLDSDYEWGQFLVRIGAVEPVAFSQRNAEFYAMYEVGKLDPVAYLQFAFGTLSQFPRKQLDAWHDQFMAEVIRPKLHAAALALVKRHQDDGDLVLIITATNRFVTAPIAKEFGVEHLIAAEPELTAENEFTGKHLGVPPYGEGKVVNLASWLAARDHKLEDFERSTFYSDSQNDIPLMSQVTHPVATNPNARLAAHATANHWPIIKLFND